MDENKFNMSIRQFLKEMGVTSQREIEIAVREALRQKKVGGSANLVAKAVITIDSVGLRHEVTGTIHLG